MQEPVLIAAVITAVLFLAVSLGDLVAKKTIRLGILYTGSGIFLALLLTVNYFVEIPWLFFLRQVLRLRSLPVCWDRSRLPERPQIGPPHKVGIGSD